MCDPLAQVLTVAEAAAASNYSVSNIWYLMQSGYLRWRYTAGGVALVDRASLERYVGRPLDGEIAVYEAVKTCSAGRRHCSSMGASYSNEGVDMIRVSMDAALVSRVRKSERGTTYVTFRDVLGSGDVSLASRNGHFDGLEEGHVIAFEAVCVSSQYGLSVDGWQASLLFRADQFRSLVSRAAQVQK